MINANSFHIPLADNSIDCVVTSPPYFALRDYNGEPNQIGIEKTVEYYIRRLLRVFDEIYRVLKPTGTVWLNIGDTYANYKNKTPRKQSFAKTSQDLPVDASNKNFKNKDLMLIPHRLAIALHSQGWWVRNDIIWSKTNPTPESMKDRFTRSHEHVFLLTKNSHGYYFDLEAAKEPRTWIENRPDGIERQGKQWRDKVKGKYDEKNDYAGGGTSFKGHSGNYRADGSFVGDPKKRRGRTVWTMPKGVYSGNHYAVMPLELAEKCVKIGCPEDGVVLDPFGGVGTTALAAKKLKRKSVSLELNFDYCKEGLGRISK